jgi:hypothetical protein
MDEDCDKRTNRPSTLSTKGVVVLVCIVLPEPSENFSSTFRTAASSTLPMTPLPIFTLQNV